MKKERGVLAHPSFSPFCFDSIQLIPKYHELKRIKR
nr:MAG TPA: hypothetical protein [Caudoviricetes sp.]